MNCEKAGFWANHTENDADMFISWHRIRNDAIVLYSTQQWNIRSWHCLELQSISRFKRFLRLSRSQDIDFFFWEQIFTSGIIHNKTSKTRNVKIYSLHAEGSHVNKNNGGTLCESTILFCGWVLVICRAGNRPEITVTVSF